MEDFLIGSLLVISFILLIVGIISPKGSTRRKAKCEQRKNEIYFFWF